MASETASHRVETPARSRRAELLVLLGALSLAAPVTAPAQRADADSAEPLGPPGAVELRVLTYNTHGLPAWAARDAPEARFPRIGELLNAYDVALIQEDFAHHELLLSTASHAIVERGNGPRSAWGGLLPALCGSCGSGLTILSRLARDRLVDVYREAYRACEGWLAAANDCLASKGFLRARLRVGEGTRVDFWVTHLDAGPGAADREVRAAQLDRLRERIAAQSAGRALIVGGDFNLDHAHAGDRALLDRFVAALGLRDSGAAPADGRWPRRIDYLLYRSGDGVALEPIEAGEADEFAEAGTPLSDHPALYVRFRIGTGE